MAPLTRVGLSLIPFVFALLAFTFSLLAITDPDWAERKQYGPDTDAISQTAPIYTLYRSPFRICTELATPENSPPPPAPVNYTYTSNCTNYRPSGLNATSCELPAVLLNNSLSQAGDARQCQQIHIAGNFSIASASLLGIALLLCLGCAGASALALSWGHRNGNALELLTRVLLQPVAVAGAAAAAIAQFYAVLGLVQSAPNNADFATSTGNAEHHDPWVQGRALSVYMSLSWFWALLMVWAAGAVWAWGAEAGEKAHGHRGRRWVDR
ncbi:hypothetical protein QBC45DRAFT_331395 [Copromyces sp. CBS 386.78]|nr:hypothetical protein QBC45DRAFT_331395 [Copromyces sp. CBS 386.78]